MGGDDVVKAQWIQSLVLAGFLCVAAFTSALAQLEPLSGSHNSQAPIEITADTLEVRNTENLAIFRGDVDAIQGDMLLKADMLIVHYRANKEPPDQQGIDVDNEKIWLTGQVVLTQGDNIIQGEQLELDLATGQSKVLSAATNDGKRERVRGLFVPKKQDN